MPVFLSHKRQDKPQVVAIMSRLQSQGVICYLDQLDPELQTTDDITNVLIKRVRECTHIMAVVSEYTQKSWWVPFEIGVASDLDKRITTYQLASVVLPDFLEKWPILRTTLDLDRFAQKYKQDNTVMLSESSGSARTISSADAFHRELKAALNQR